MAELRQDIRFIRLGDLRLQPVGSPLFGSFGFWIFALLPLAGVAGAVALRRHQELVAGDVAYARGRRAGKLAKRRLAEARRLQAEGDQRVFYSEVAQALTGLISDRLNLAEAGLQIREIDEALSAAGVSQESRDEVRACLDHCDRQRFAPGSDATGERDRFLGRVGDLMGAIDQEVR